MMSDESKRSDKLCELNVIEQVVNVCETTIVQDAWGRGQALAVHGWIYTIHDGPLRDLNGRVTKSEEAISVYHQALSALC